MSLSMPCIFLKVYYNMQLNEILSYFLECGEIKIDVYLILYVYYMLFKKE